MFDVDTDSPLVGSHNATKTFFLYAPLWFAKSHSHSSCSFLYLSLYKLKTTLLSLCISNHILNSAILFPFLAFTSSSSHLFGKCLLFFFAFRNAFLFEILVSIWWFSLYFWKLMFNLWYPMKHWHGHRTRYGHNHSDTEK